jgi:hypothetical protein
MQTKLKTKNLETPDRELPKKTTGYVDLVRLILASVRNLRKENVDINRSQMKTKLKKA